MADRLQISSSVHKDLVKWINELPERKKDENSFSRLVEILLWEAKENREKKGGKKS